MLEVSRIKLTIQNEFEISGLHQSVHTKVFKYIQLRGCYIVILCGPIMLFCYIYGTALRMI